MKTDLVKEIHDAMSAWTLGYPVNKPPEPDACCSGQG